MTEKELWFDVGIKRYTTQKRLPLQRTSCGLMQESKDIQHSLLCTEETASCGLMQESKDIQPADLTKCLPVSCGLMQESKDIQRRRFRDADVPVVV